jgi:hypothetical protein
MSGGGQRIPVSISPGSGGVGFHAASRAAGALQTQSPAVANVTIQQVLGSMVTSFSLSIPALGQQGATADVSFTQALGLPNITLAKGATGLVVVTLDLAEQGSGVTVNFSRQLQYGGISPQNTWTLPAGATFNGGKVVGVARCVALKTAAAQTLTVLCNAHVLGVPPAGGS